ncbi:hypothetical protein FB567DRAFT_586350 [Paraphoma chrysanthemicola]|uniref:BTB domain-containing protein n=1 Tax=Paraphoma chrysanthemicola TaxID=798071 RepID=A0A8K0RJN5_9PLEO|nr:hypothetical protein FB567DRAFT_586350 [Paraphoma chrysanthemicola]
MATGASIGINFSSECGRILQADAFNLLDMITVSIGSDNVRYPVHEDVIRKSSKFFDNAMKPEWANARPNPREVDLSDEEPKIFQIYLHCMYFKTLPSVHTTIATGWNPEYVQLGGCYVMGEKLMDTAFKNAVLTALADAIDNQPFYEAKYPGSKTIHTVYEGTTEDAPARRMLVDIWVELAGENWVKYLTSSLHHSFVLEFSRALLLSKCPGWTADTRSWKERVKDYYEE